MRSYLQTSEISTDTHISSQPLEILNRNVVLTSFHTRQEIGANGSWHRVASGAVRQYTIQADGRRQIVDLLLLGDWFGVPAPDHQRFFWEAIEGTLIASYSRSRLEAIARDNLEVAALVQDATFETVLRLQRQLLILGRITALEKVGSFLLEISRRLTARNGEMILLPFSRCDIADYLAVSVETVSRSLTELKERRVIALMGARQFKIIDRGALEHLRHP